MSKMQMNIPILEDSRDRPKQSTPKIVLRHRNPGTYMSSHQQWTTRIDHQPKVKEIQYLNDDDHHLNR